MKRDTAGWAVAGLMIVLGASMGAMQQATQSGRFTIAVITFRGEGGDQDTLLLDTATGDTRLLTRTRREGKIEWTPVLPQSEVW
jgi:hypothetical protein